MLIESKKAVIRLLMPFVVITSKRITAFFDSINITTQENIWERSSMFLVRFAIFIVTGILIIAHFSKKYNK